MAAGKSTIIRKLFGKDPNAVLIAADDFKFKDPLFDVHHASPQLKLAVHKSSTKTAESLLLTCLANGRSVILDGTLSWFPFMKQTVEMIRDYKNHAYYRVGPGYCRTVNDDGTVKVTEKYWEVCEQCDRRSLDYKPSALKSKRQSEECALPTPYRVEVVGVVCDPAEAVIRGFRRHLNTGRGVPLRSQLRSHRLFAENVVQAKFLRLVDKALVYDSTTSRDPNPFVDFDIRRDAKVRDALKSEANVSGMLAIEREHDGLAILDRKSWRMIERVRALNDNATHEGDLYRSP